LVAVGMSASIGAMAVIAASAPPAAASSKCRSLSRHHFKTPHKDGDRDRCDRHGTDDGDGSTT
jgi:serine acetyltransferase